MSTPFGPPLPPAPSGARGPAWKRPGVRAAVVLALGVLVAALVLIARTSGSSAHAVPDTGHRVFLYRGSAEVMAISWTGPSAVDARLDDLTLSSDGTPHATHENIEVTIGGSTVDVSVGLSSPWHGSLKGDTLTLGVPQDDGTIAALVLTASSTDAYNAAVTALTGQGQARRNDAAQASASASAEASAGDADSALGHAVSSLESDVTTAKQTDVSYGSVFDSFARDWQSEQADYGTVERQVGAHDCGDAGTSAGTVGTDSGTVQTDEGTYQTDRLTSDAIRSDITAVKNAESALSVALADSPGTVVAVTPSAADAAVNAASGVADGIDKADKTADGKAASYVSQAETLSGAATHLAMSCTG